MNKIVVITGSPRKDGNTDLLTEAFVKAAREKGNTVEQFDAGRMKIQGCHACYACYKTGKPCAFDDDFNPIALSVLEADVLVFAMPTYWYSMSIQLVSNEHNALIQNMFEETTSSIKIISPFIGMEMAKILSDLLLQNSELKAEIVTRFYREDFIRGVSKINALEKLHSSGAKIYALQDLHTKLYLFDLDAALLGSANFTSGGFRLNHELSLCVTEENDVNPQLISYFDDLISEITRSGDFLLTAEKIAEEKHIVTTIQNQRKGNHSDNRNEKRFGAKISIPASTPATEPEDTIQTILSRTANAQYSETIWLKFEGSAVSRVSMTEYYSPHTTQQFPTGVTFFSDAKKPTNVKEGDYVYMARYCETDLPYIVGRGRSAGYREGNIATPDMIAEHNWKAKYPCYYQFTEFEYIDAPISECISLTMVLSELGSSFYVSTEGKSLSIEKLRIRHRQQAHMRLTPHGKEYIDMLFDDLSKKFGIKRIVASGTAPKQSSFTRSNDETAISLEMIKIAYEIAKKVYDGSVGRTRGRDMIAEQTGMNSGSAGDYITNYGAMRDGIRYTRTLSSSGTRYYFESIKRDFGSEALRTALKAGRAHVEYYGTLGYGKLRGISKIIDEFATEVDL